MTYNYPIYPGAGDPRFDPADPLVSPDYSGWWQRCMAVIRHGWRALLLVQLCTTLPALVLIAPAQVLIDLVTNELQQTSVTGRLPDLSGYLTVGAGALVAMLIGGLIYAVGTLAGARVVVAVATGRELGPGQAIRSVLPRVPAMIGWSLLGSLLTVAAVLACFLPVLYVAAALAVLPVVVLFEPGNGIARCFQLFHTELGAAVARVVTIAAISVVSSLAFAVVSTLVSVLIRGRSALDPAIQAGTSALVTDSIAATAIAGVGSLLTAILITPMIVATYADLRARREPFVTAFIAQP